MGTRIQIETKDVGNVMNFVNILTKQDVLDAEAKFLDKWNNVDINWTCSCGVSNSEKWKIFPKKCKNCGLPRGL